MVSGEVWANSNMRQVKTNCKLKRVRMKKKIVSLLLTGVMAAGVLAGCGGQSIADQQAAGDTTADSAEGEAAEETVTMAAADEVDGTEITFWHSMGGVNGQAIDELVNRFNEENELGITVVSEYQGEYDDALNKLRSAQIGNMGADLVQVYEIGTRFMIDSGWIIPMQEMIDQDNYDVSQIEPNLAAYYTIDDQLYSMPFNSSTPLIVTFYIVVLILPYLYRSLVVSTSSSYVIKITRCTL